MIGIHKFINICCQISFSSMPGYSICSTVINICGSVYTSVCVPVKLYTTVQIPALTVLMLYT